MGLRFTRRVRIARTARKLQQERREPFNRPSRGAAATRAGPILPPARPLVRPDAFRIRQATQLLQAYTLSVRVEYPDAGPFERDQAQNVLMRRPCVEALVHNLTNANARRDNEAHGRRLAWEVGRCHECVMAGG
jgi:hypothetical protein